MAARKGTREESKKRLKRLEEGYPKGRGKNVKVTPASKREQGQTNKTSRDRRQQLAKLRKDI